LLRYRLNTPYSSSGAARIAISTTLTPPAGALGTSSAAAGAAASRAAASGCQTSAPAAGAPGCGFCCARCGGADQAARAPPNGARLLCVTAPLSALATRCVEHMLKQARLAQQARRSGCCGLPDADAAGACNRTDCIVGVSQSKYPHATADVLAELYAARTCHSLVQSRSNLQRNRALNPSWLRQQASALLPLGPWSA